MVFKIFKAGQGSRNGSIQQRCSRGVAEGKSEATLVLAGTPASGMKTVCSLAALT